MQIEIKELLKRSSYFSNNDYLKEKIDKIIDLEDLKREALLVYLNSKTYEDEFFKEELNKKEGNKIFIDFSDISYSSSFPAPFFVKKIYEKLDEFNIHYEGDYSFTPKCEAKVDVETYYDNLLGILKTDLYSLELDKPLYILINNIDLPYDNDFSLTFYRHFVFDKRFLPKNLHVFLITNNKQQKEQLSEYLNTVEFEKDLSNPKLLFKELMEMGGAKLSDELLLLATPTLKLNDYFYVAKYILNYCPLDDYNRTLQLMLSKYNTEEILFYIFNDFYKKLSEKGKAIFSEGLIDLYMFNFGLTLDEVINSGRYLLNKENKYLINYDEIDTKEKEEISSFLEFFACLEDNRLVMSDKTIKDFIGSNAMILTGYVTSRYEKRLVDAIDYIYKEFDKVEITRYIYNKKSTYSVDKDIYLNDIGINNKIAKKNLVKNAIFDVLLDRLALEIASFGKTLESYKEFDKKEISDKESFIISFVERATVIAESATNYSSIDNILTNKYLLYLIASKSRRMFKRIVCRYINTAYDYQTKVLNATADGYGVFVPLAGCLAHLFKEDEFNNLQRELITLAAEVMDENGALVNSNFKDELDQYNVCPIVDFVLNNGNEDVVNELDLILGELKKENPDFRMLKEKVRLYSSKYQDEENVYIRVMYAYLALKTYVFLGENRWVNKELSSYLEPIMLSVIIDIEYCYYPEVYGAIYMYFGRIYPTDYLNRLEMGIHLLKSQGYLKGLKLFISAFNYFSSIKQREGK